eukprot:542627-Pyramimonas_sp.AAC.1
MSWTDKCIACLKEKLRDLVDVADRILKGPVAGGRCRAGRCIECDRDYPEAHCPVDLSDYRIEPVLAWMDVPGGD